MLHSDQWGDRLSEDGDCAQDLCVDPRDLRHRMLTMSRLEVRRLRIQDDVAGGLENRRCAVRSCFLAGLVAGI